MQCYVFEYMKALSDMYLFVLSLKCSIKQYNCSDSECTEFTLCVMVSEDALVSDIVHIRM